VRDCLLVSFWKAKREAPAPFVPSSRFRSRACDEIVHELEVSRRVDGVRVGGELSLRVTPFCHPGYRECAGVHWREQCKARKEDAASVYGCTIRMREQCEAREEDTGGNGVRPRRRMQRGCMRPRHLTQSTSFDGSCTHLVDELQAGLVGDALVGELDGVERQGGARGQHHRAGREQRHRLLVNGGSGMIVSVRVRGEGTWEKPNPTRGSPGRDSPRTQFKPGARSPDRDFTAGTCQRSAHRLPPPPRDSPPNPGPAASYPAFRSIPNFYTNTAFFLGRRRRRRRNSGEESRRLQSPPRRVTPLLHTSLATP
jgi:hypothetical protein